MGFLKDMISKSVKTAATNSTILAIGAVASELLSVKSKRKEKDTVIVKNGKTLIYPTRSNENYKGQSVINVVKELRCAGFENIEIQPIKKLNEFAAKKYGKIHSISINGNDDFNENKKFSASAYILIQYFDFKDSISPDIYNIVKKIDAEAINGCEEKPAMISAPKKEQLPHPEVEPTPVIKIEQESPHIITKQFCSCCGEKIQDNNARFCIACGAKIEED